MDNQRCILVLYNTYSGNGRGCKLSEKAIDFLNINRLTFNAHQNDWPENLVGFSEVWLFGGDGTLNYFLNKYDSINIPLALFPGGTGNDFHWKLYGNLSVEDQLIKVLNNNIIKTDLGICNGERFINMVGLGFDGAVLKDVKTARFVGGHLGYLLLVIKNIFTFKEKQYDVELNGRRFTINSLLFLVTNSSRTGGGFMVSPHAKIDDGLLDVIYCEALNIFQRLFLLPKVEKGKHINDKKIKTALSSEVCINCIEKIYYQLDGELRSANSFNISIQSRKLQFLI